MMNTKELRGKKMGDLRKMEHELSQELFRLKFRQKSGQLHNGAGIATVRKHIARVKTIMREQR